MAINWTYDEIVLAAELVYDNSWQALGPTKPRVKELSELLRAAQIHPWMAEIRDSGVTTALVGRRQILRRVIPITEE